MTQPFRDPVLSCSVAARRRTHRRAVEKLRPVAAEVTLRAKEEMKKV